MNIELLKKEMGDRNININKLSELSKVDKSVISRLINGKSNTCTVETAQAISDAMNLSNTKRGLIFFGREVAKPQQLT